MTGAVVIHPTGETTTTVGQGTAAGETTMTEGHQAEIEREMCYHQEEMLREEMVVVDHTTEIADGVGAEVLIEEIIVTDRLTGLEMVTE